MMILFYIEFSLAKTFFPKSTGRQLDCTPGHLANQFEKNTGL